MINLASFTGPKAFGKAYQYMLDNDAHAQGSVDRETASSMIRLCHETVGSTARTSDSLIVTGRIAC